MAAETATAPVTARTGRVPAQALVPVPAVLAARARALPVTRGAVPAAPALSRSVARSARAAPAPQVVAVAARRCLALLGLRRCRTPTAVATRACRFAPTYPARP